MALLAPGTCTSTPQFVPSGPRTGLICLAISRLVGSQHQRMQSLPADESRVDLVPVLHARLAQPPAIECFATIDLSAKVDEPGVHAFADDSQIVELGDVVLDVAGETLRLDLQQLRNHVGMLGARADRGKLELTHLLFPEMMITDEIFDDPFHQRKRAVRFIDREQFFHVSYTGALRVRGQVRFPRVSSSDNLSWSLLSRLDFAASCRRISSGVSGLSGGTGIGFPLASTATKVR